MDKVQLLPVGMASVPIKKFQERGNIPDQVFCRGPDVEFHAGDLSRRVRIVPESRRDQSRDNINITSASAPEILSVFP